MSDPFVDQVRERVDIVEVVGSYVELKRAGKSWKGRCPFHEEKTPSFHVNPDRQLFHCFGCQKGGDVFRFLMELERLTFPEALERLARRAGLTMPRRGGWSREPQGLAQVVEFAVAYYEGELREPERGREGRAFLKTRGIKAETALEYRLGLAGAGWEGLVRAARGRFEEGALLKAGLCVQKEGGGGVYDRLRRRLVIPIASPGGVWVGLAGRALEEGEVKYLNTADSLLYHKSSVLYGLPQARPFIRESQRAILVEGYLDVLTLHQAGVREAVASSGTALTQEHARLLKRFTDQVTVLYDGDEAGRSAALRCLRPLLRAGVRPRIAFLEGGEDPDSLVRKFGVGALQQQLEAAADWLAVLRRHALLPDRTEVRLEAVASLLAEVEDDLLRAAFTRDAAHEFSFFEDVLHAAVEKRRRTPAAEPAGPTRSPAPGGGRPAYESAGRQLLRWLCHRPVVLERLGPLATEEWFEDPADRDTFRALVGHLERPLEDPGAAVTELAAVPPEEGLEEDQAYLLAAQLEERRLRREVVRLRESLRDLASEDERRERMAHIGSLEAQIQDLKARAGEALLERLHPVQGMDGGAAPA
ncbi:MAG TPA: DNA primase [Candidatus Saccharimonadales bacterium]|nr:DNA primase [Candidatus Saccharimonadales bacterium]